MRKNQKFTKEQMYARIESWKQSGLSQNQFCKEENLSTSTFNYWLKKYKQEKDLVANADSKPVKTFLPVEVTQETIHRDKDCITITYPNGIQVCCPVNLE
jgi:transposase-like protein